MKCAICKRKIVGDCHSPFPLSRRGVCCDSCHPKVLEARIKEFGRLMIQAEKQSKKRGAK